MRATQKKTTWKRKTWTQLKAQHKLLRVFYQKFELGEDPIRLHTGAQKLTVLWLIILVKMTVSSMLSQTSAQSGVRQNTVAENILLRVLIGMISASFSLPASVALDQMFWKQQRMTNKKQMHDKDTSEVQLIARAALHCTFNYIDTQQAIMMWRLAIEELKVMEMTKALHASRFGRLKRLQDDAAKEKIQKEVDNFCSDFEKAGLNPSQFLSLVVAASVGAEDERQIIENLLYAAAKRLQDGFHRWRANKRRHDRALTAIRVARRWKSRIRNKKAMRELDAVIVSEVVRCQRAYRIHAHERRKHALQQANLLADLRRPSRLAAPSPKNNRRKSAIIAPSASSHNLAPSASAARGGALVLPTTHFDPSGWFEEPDAQDSLSPPAGRIRWSDRPPSSPMVKVPPALKFAIKRGRDALPDRGLPDDGRYGYKGYGFASVVEMRADENYEHLEQLSTPNRLSGYQPISRSGNSSACSSRTVSVSNIFFDSEATSRNSPVPAAIIFAWPRERLKRRIAIYHPAGRQTLAARAHVIAHRAAVEAERLRGQRLIVVPTEKAGGAAKRPPLMYFPYEDLVAVDYMFRNWCEFAIVKEEEYEEEGMAMVGRRGRRDNVFGAPGARFTRPDGRARGDDVKASERGRGCREALGGHTRSIPTEGALAQSSQVSIRRV